MSVTEVAQLVREFVVDNFLFGDGADDLSDDDSFLDRGLIDSTGVLELVTFIEEAFGVTVADEELIPANLDTVNRVAVFVSGKSVQR